MADSFIKIPIKADISDAKNEVNKLGGTLKSLTATIGVAGAAFGVVGGAVAGVGKITDFAKDFADSADVIADGAGKTGVAVEAFQQYTYAAKLSGLETDKLQSIMTKSQTSFADAKNGSKGLGDAYASLGVNIADIGNSSDAFDQTILALAGVEDVTKRNAIANDIFGKSYAELGPLLDSGVDGIQALKQEAVDMGTVMSEDAVNSGADFNDTLDKIKMTLGGVMNSLGTQLMPVVQEFMGIIEASIPELSNLVSSILPVLVSVFQELAPPLMQMVKDLLPVFLNLFTQIAPVIADLASSLLPVLVKIITTLLPPLMQLVVAILPIVIQLIDALLPIVDLLLELLMPILNLIMGILTPLIDLITLILPPIIQLLSFLIEIALKPLILIFKLLAGILTEVVGGAFERIMILVSGITQIFGGLIDFITGVFTGDWGKAWDGISQVFLGIVNIITGTVSSMVNTIISIINFMLGAINSVNFKVPDWIPGIGGTSFGFNIPLIGEFSIPKLAKGGVIGPNSEFLAILGDQSSGVNIEAPLETIKQGLRDVMDEQSGGDTTIVIPVSIGGEKIEKVVVKATKDASAKNNGR